MKRNSPRNRPAPKGSRRSHHGRVKVIVTGSHGKVELAAPKKNARLKVIVAGDHDKVTMVAAGAPHRMAYGGFTVIGLLSAIAFILWVITFIHSHP